ncbi:hypothetical protein ABID21_003502 [Pseudorhizobium tarimense]|uniref:Uncharacterized protein n=1 Tax=Pseudorhizobium tarimense TaxID=1079109 RepID=A0ABV2HAZ3_9HYPH|nr:hypothetical protein [Pseudorhizobium tarimense]MCJ8520614.1 hypothetical protein [Pseudorhizobium tarimense]
MTAPALANTSSHPKRVRASDHALRIALKAIQDAGLPVDKVCVTGAQIEIHCRPVDAEQKPANDGGLKDW